MTLDQLKAMDDRGRAALCAEQVMGMTNNLDNPKQPGMWGIMDWTDRGPVLAPNFPLYDTPESDYEVLEHVRETFEYRKLADFAVALREIHASRFDAFKKKRKWYAYPDRNRSEVLYEPGDYALAALAVVTES